jgi:hypothetical protein
MDLLASAPSLVYLQNFNESFWVSVCLNSEFMTENIYS